MKFNYEEKKQLIQLAKLMREGSKLYPKKTQYLLFTEENKQEACALGCVISQIIPEARNKYINGEDLYKLLEEPFPVLNKPLFNGKDIIGQIFDWNDLQNLPVLTIADKIEALTYEEVIS